MVLTSLKKISIFGGHKHFKAYLHTVFLLSFQNTNELGKTNTAPLMF